jgi:hypothetical protein
MRFLSCALAPVVALVLAGAVTAQPYYGDPVPRLIEEMSRKMRLLAEDIPVEVHDGRGQALTSQATDILAQIQHMQAEVRKVSPDHMRKEAVELDRKFHHFREGVLALGGEGQYLARFAEQVEGLDHEILRIVGNPGQPPATQPPVAQPPMYQPWLIVYPSSYMVPGYQTSYPPCQPGVTIYYRR